MTTTNEKMTLADAIRDGLGIVGGDQKKERDRICGLLFPPLVVFLSAKNGGRAKIQGRSDGREWDMRYLRVQIGFKTDLYSGIEIVPRFSLCAFEDGGCGRDLSPLEALDHIDPADLRDRLQDAVARMGDVGAIRV